MSNKLKVLGLAFVAIFAMSAVAASAASAAETFHSDGHPTTLTAEAKTNQVFTTTVGKVTCTAVSLDNTTITAEETHEITAHPTYTGCTGPLGITIRVNMTSCDYNFTSTRTGEHAQVHIECATTGDEIDVRKEIFGVESECIRVPAQTPTGGGVTYTNGEANGIRDVVVKATVTGIKYTEMGGVGCGTAGTVVNDGTYTGEVTVKGDNDPGGEPTSIWWE